MKTWTLPAIALLALAFTFPATSRSQDPAPTPPAVDFTSLNKALGAVLFADDNLFDDQPEIAAGRLGWPMESKTKFSESYRLYPPAEMKLLGARPYSLSLHAAGGQPIAVIMIFANKGDIVSTYMQEQRIMLPLDSDEREQLIRKTASKLSRQLKDAVTTDSTAIETQLTTLLGEPKREVFGQARGMKQTVSRWDWAGHSFLLSVPDDEYVLLKILPEGVASADGKVERTSDTQLRAELKERVVTRPNEDVILSELPMVDQGPKGYCVPANWERTLRYLGIPADMYELAMAGGTNLGGGTHLDQMAKAVVDLLRKNGRRMVSVSGRPNVRLVKKYIDDGIPIMWGIVLIDSLDAELTIRAMQRAHVTDMKEWKTALKQIRRNARRLDTKDMPGHLCLIVGYNPETEEIAISDSWGPDFAERWITEDEAQAISQGEMYVVSW